MADEKKTGAAVPAGEKTEGGVPRLTDQKKEYEKPKVTAAGRDPEKVLSTS